MPTNPCSSTPSPSPSGRTRTPSDLKWLLNERAALAGQAKALAGKLKLLRSKVVRLERQLAEARASEPELSAKQAEAAARIDALDRAMALAYEAVNPSAAGCVNAWAGRYGERGALREFVMEHLRSVAPEAVPLAALHKLVIAKFALELRTPRERASLRRTLSTLLHRLLNRDGLVEAVERWQGKQLHPLWRWKQPPSSLDGLRLAALAAETADDAPPDPDAL